MPLFYSLCCICLCVPSFGMFPAFLVSRPIPAFYAKILFFTPATWDSTRGTERGAQGRSLCG